MRKATSGPDWEMPVIAPLARPEECSGNAPSMRYTSVVARLAPLALTLIILPVAGFAQSAKLEDNELYQAGLRALQDRFPDLAVQRGLPRPRHQDLVQESGQPSCL